LLCIFILLLVHNSILILLHIGKCCILVFSLTSKQQVLQVSLLHLLWTPIIHYTFFKLSCQILFQEVSGLVINKGRVVTKSIETYWHLRIALHSGFTIHHKCFSVLLLFHEFEFSFESGIKMILDMIISSSRQKFSDFWPPVA
jgi:hypothetical protein